MKRRDALKNLGLATGFFAITPSVVSLMQSCTTDIKSWTPEFLTIEQGVLLTKLVDIFLPKTEKLPSATELNVPQFIDRYCNASLDDSGKTQLLTAFDKVILALKPNTKESLEKVSDDHCKSFLDKHLLLNNEIDSERDDNPGSIDLTKSEFLKNVRSMTIRAYLTTQQIGENVLLYDPVPSQFYCGDLNELTGGLKWSL